MKPKSTTRSLLAIAASSLMAVSSASAQTTVNWDGSDSATWATAANWDTAPTNSLTANIANFDIATYGGNPVFAPTVGTATSIAGITIGASNGTMTLTNTAALSIGASGISIANGAGAFTISGSTTLGAAQNWANSSANLFTFGAVTAGANLLTIGGSGDINASGIISGTNGALTKEGAGLLTLNAANTYTGATTVNGGEVRWGITNAIAGGALNINNGGTVNMQDKTDTVGTVTIAQGGTITGTTGVLTVPASVGGGFVSNDGGTMTGATLSLAGSAGLTYNSTGPGSTTLQIDKISVTDSGSNTFNIADGDAAVDFDITGFVNNGGSNVGRNIIKTGAGAMQFSGSTMGGTGQNGIFLNINEGTVLMNRATGVAFAPGSNHAITVGDSNGSAGTAILKFASTGGDNQLGTRAITINSDGLFDLNGKTQSTGNAITLNGTGQLQLNNGQLTAASLTLNPSDGNTTSISLGASGTLTLGGDVTFNAAGTGRAQITGSDLSMGAANRIFNMGLGSGADHDLIIGAGISGATRSLTKNGLGRLVLTGSNSYTGGTIVNAGTLQIGDGTTAGTMTSTGALTLGNATFAVRGPAGGSSQTVGSLATSASTGSTIRLTPGTSGNTTLTITGTTLSTGAGASVNFDYTAGTTVGGTVGNNYVVWNPTLTAGIIGGAYTVTDSGGTGFATTSGGNVVRLTDPGSSGLPVSTGSSTGSYFVASGYSTVDTAEPGSLVLALSGGVAASNVTVNTSGLASGANLALGTNLLTLGAGMVFDGPNAYEISGSSPGGLRAAASGGTINLYNANTNTVTISAPIVANGASRLTIDGPGTTVLSGANTYTGATVVNGGTVRFSGTMGASAITINNDAVAQLGTATGLNSGNSVTFGAGATGSLELLGNNLTIGALNSNATTLGAPVITNNSVANATLTIDSASASSLGGVVQDGTGGGILTLAKSGSGTLTLSGTNTYSGGTTINAGAVSVTADANLGDASGGITLAGGRLMASGVTTARTVTVNGTGSSIYAVKNSTFSTSGALTGSGSLTFVNPGGSGTTSIYNFTSTANTFTGAMSVEVADVRVSSLSDAAANNIVFTGAGAFSLSSTGVTTGLTFNNRAIELSNTSATVGNNNATHAVTIGSNLVATGAAAKTLTLSAVAGPTNVFSGTITNGTGGGTVGITKSGNGTWLLGNSANSYTGATQVLDGTLVVKKMADYGSNSSIGAAASGPGITLGNGSIMGSLVYEGTGDSTNRFLRLGGQATILNNGTGALNFTAATFEVTGASTTNAFIIGGSNGGSISGAIPDKSAPSQITAITKTGTGTWTLGGTNTYTGTTTLNGGRLVLDYAASNTTKLANGAAITLGGGDLELSGGSHTEVVASTTLTNNTGTRITQTNSGASVLQLGTITRSNGGSTLSFSADNIATTNNTNTNGILGPGYTVGSHWAVNFTNGANGQIRALSTYTTTVPTSGGVNTANYQLTGDQTQTGNLAANTLRIVNGANDDELSLATHQLNLTSTNGVMGAFIYAGGFNDNYTISGTTGIIKAATGNNHLGVNVFTGTLTVNALFNSGSATTTKWGAGTLVIGSNNSGLSGAHFVQEGTLRLANSGATGTTAGGIVVSNGAALELSNSVAIGAEALTISGHGISNAGALRNVASNTSSYAGAITIGTGGARINSDSGGSLTLTGGVATSLYNNVTFGGAGNTIVSTTAISGAGGVVKDGAGTLVLSGNTANTYSGGTFVNEGTLRVTNTGGSGTGASAVTVASGAALGGTGVVGGSATFNNGSIFAWNLSVTNPALTNSATVADNFTVSGNLVDGGTAGDSVFRILLEGSQTFADNFWTANQSWSNVFVSGNSVDLEDVFTSFSYANASGTIAGPTGGSYFTLSGTTLSFTAIPEPSTALGGLLLTAGLLRRRRRGERMKFEV